MEVKFLERFLIVIVRQFRPLAQQLRNPVNQLQKILLNLVDCFLINLGYRPEVKTAAKSASRDSFISKLQICMNTYNYEDESTDTIGKVYNSIMSSQNDYQH